MDRGRSHDILQYIRDRENRLVDLLRALTEAESPSSIPDSQHQVRGLFAEALEELDFHTVPLNAAAPGGHLYARPRHRNRSARPQLLLGHYDTVWPLGTVLERPFEVDGRVIRGPGVFDMKGGLVQIVLALEALDALGLQPALPPLVFVNGDEEIGSRTSGRTIRRLAKCAARAFVLEPALSSAGKLKTRRKGVGRFTVTVHGRAAHAGLDPDGGASAILELSFVIQKLFALNDPDQGVSINVGTVDGGMHANVIAPLSQAVVDVRVPTERDAQRVQEAIFSITPTTPGVRVRATGEFGRPPLEATSRNVALWQLARRLGETLDLKLEDGLAGGGSDGCTTSQYTATLDGLGPVGDGAHAAHEYLHIDRTIERAALLALLMLAPDDAGDGWLGFP